MCELSLQKCAREAITRIKTAVEPKQLKATI